MEHWQMDLISFAEPTMIHLNNGMQYALTVINLFSKKAWAIQIKNKFAEDIVAGLQKIFASNADKYPTILQSDNGSEFKNDVVDNYFKQHDVKSIHLLAYKPTSQGAIERWNQTLKHLIYQHFT